MGRGHFPGDRKWGLGREIRENFLLALVHMDLGSEEDLFTVSLPGGPAPWPLEECCQDGWAVQTPSERRHRCDTLLSVITF